MDGIWNNQNGNADHPGMAITIKDERDIVATTREVSEEPYRKLSKDKINLLVYEYNHGANKSGLAREFGISRSTVRRYLAERTVKQNKDKEL